MPSGRARCGAQAPWRQAGHDEVYGEDGEVGREEGDELAGGDEDQDDEELEDQELEDDEEEDNEEEADVEDDE